MLSEGLKKVLIGIVGGIAILSLVSATTIVRTGYTGVITRFGAVQERTLESGIHLKMPFIERVNKMNNQIQILEDSSNAMSKDKQSVDYEVSVNYRLLNASYIYKNIGKDYSDIIISKNITDATKNVLARYDCEDITDKRDELAPLVLDELQKKINEALGGNDNIIQITSVQINNFGFSEEFTKAKEEKSVAQQKLLAEKQNTQIKEEQANQKKVEAQGEADASIIKANGEAEANRKLQESLTDGVLKKQMLDKWDGKLPTVSGNAQNILDVNSLIK